MFKKICFILLSLSIGYSIQISRNNICFCSQITSSSECPSIIGCFWNMELNFCQAQQTCPTFGTQQQCLELSDICQWDYNQCNTFQGCNTIQPYPTDFKYCRNANINCLAFDGHSCQSIKSSSFSTYCIDYPFTYCTENIGLDGVCIWSTSSQNCQPITSCESLIEQQQCEFGNQAHGYACQYINGICKQITNCNVFTTASSCKYYFPSVTSTTMILCEWIISSNTCQNAENTLYLNEQTCLISTGFNYRWIPNIKNPKQGICASCQIQISNQPIVSQSQCLCSQFILQSECNTYYCTYNQQLNICQDKECSQVTQQSICVTMKQCFWDYQNTGQCANFYNCASLPTKINAQACAAQSIQCPGFSDGICQGVDTLQYCSANSDAQGCMNMFGKDGLCTFYNNLCLPLQSCAQIREPAQCNSWQNLCEWNYTLYLCQKLTCSSYNNNPTKCLYVITGFQESQYEFCKYNSNSGICENLTSAIHLNSQNCAINTASTYRWTQATSKQGICAPCQLIRIQTQDQCRCFQYLTQSDCLNSGYCSYGPDSLCIQKTCIEIYNQLTCLTSINCYWNATKGCTSLNSCSDLTANNLSECLAQNVSCKGFSSSTNTCSTYPQQSCSSYSLSECSNSIGFEGICYINNNQCTSLSTCQGLSQTVCNKVLLACYWNSTQGNCQQMQCSQFQTKQQCKFYIEQPNSSSIIICQWNNNQCIVASDVMNQLTQQNCRINTGNTYRWIPTQNNGYCIKCQQQIILSNQCPCRYLYTQNNCYQSQECLWNYQQNICQSKQCNQILIKSICLTSTQYCGWDQQTQQCINRQQINCNQLLGQTQQQCLQQSLNCLGTNGINCLSNLGSCQYYNTEQQCFESYGNDGVCMWDNFNQTCIGVLECSSLPQYLCSIKSYACYYYDNKCQTLTCQTLYLNTGQCTHVMTLHMPYKIQSCQFLFQNDCVGIDKFQLNESECFSNSGHTARWIPFKNPQYPQQGLCELCTNNLIPLGNQSRCQCPQFLTQQDCINPENLCYWYNNMCNYNETTNSQYICSQQTKMYWLFSQDQFPSECTYLDSCRYIYQTTSAACLASSKMCRGATDWNCQENPLYQCNVYTESNCYGMIGTDGVCFFEEKTGCQGLGTCSQIFNLYECEGFFKNACKVQNNLCVAMQCSFYSIPASCNYVISSLLTGQIQLCQWDAKSQSCINLKSQKTKNYSDCGTSTAMTHRWIPLSQENIIEGYCTTCQAQVTYAPGQCACNQLFFSQDCKQNPSCSWNGSNCYASACSSIYAQFDCSMNPKCAWSEANQVCQPFTQCSDLAGVNAAECLSYSIHCNAVSTLKLHNNKYNCTALILNECVSTNYYDCVKTNLQTGVCLWIQQNNNSFCSKVLECQQLSMELCLSFPHTCFWGYVGDSKGCFQITRCAQVDGLSYYFSQFGNLSNSIIFCFSNIAQPIIIQQLASNNCSSETFSMYRWSSQNSEQGYCEKCAQDVLLEGLQTTCSCSQLNQNESLILPQCQCNNFDFQSQCRFAGCVLEWGQQIWCEEFTNCSVINATSTAQCKQACIKCPVFNQTTKTCSPIPKCDDQKSEYDCNILNTYVTFPICFWNQNQCQTINNCSQILDIYECGLQSNRCQWTTKCVPQTCNSYTSQNNCKFIYTSYTPGDIALCQWNYQRLACENAPLSNAATFSEYECFQNTGFNYHFDGDSCVRCLSQILSAIVILILH